MNHFVRTFLQTMCRCRLKCPRKYLVFASRSVSQIIAIAIIVIDCYQDLLDRFILDSVKIAILFAAYNSGHTSVYIYIYMSVCLSVCLSVSLSLSLSPSPSLSFYLYTLFLACWVYSGTQRLFDLVDAPWVTQYQCSLVDG